ncbi:hypothetical protein TcCL_NonESM05087 [Trypanosoma cruzi]|nr:hypothetical protein TcCL_NonESM05087 [Trypanosoma cruzi]
MGRYRRNEMPPEIAHSLSYSYNPRKSVEHVIIIPRHRIPQNKAIPGFQKGHPIHGFVTLLNTIIICLLIKDVAEKRSHIIHSTLHLVPVICLPLRRPIVLFPNANYPHIVFFRAIHYYSCGSNLLRPVLVLTRVW